MISLYYYFLECTTRDENKKVEIASKIEKSSRKNSNIIYKIIKGMEFIPYRERQVKITLKSTNLEGGFECPICLEAFATNQEKVSNSCGHSLCSSCTMIYLRTQQKNGQTLSCPMCRCAMVSLVSCALDTYKDLSSMIHSIDFLPIKQKPQEGRFTITYMTINRNRRVFT